MVLSPRSRSLRESDIRYMSVLWPATHVRLKPASIQRRFEAIWRSGCVTLILETRFRHMQHDISKFVRNRSELRKSSTRKTRPWHTTPAKYSD